MQYNKIVTPCWPTLYVRFAHTLFSVLDNSMQLSGLNSDFCYLLSIIQNMICQICPIPDFYFIYFFICSVSWNFWRIIWLFCVIFTHWWVFCKRNAHLVYKLFYSQPNIHCKKNTRDSWSTRFTLYKIYTNKIFILNKSIFNLVTPSPNF